MRNLELSVFQKDEVWHWIEGRLREKEGNKSETRQYRSELRNKHSKSQSERYTGQEKDGYELIQKK